MNKKLQLLFTLGLTLSCVAFAATGIERKSNADTLEFKVEFFTNYNKQDFTLSNGVKAKGNNIIYKTIYGVGKIEQPNPDPVRKNYDFTGWFKEASCENKWDFANDMLEGNTRLYAGWEFAQEEVDPEPSYTPPSTVLPDSETEDYVINSVMYFPVNGGEVKVTNPAIAKLEASKTNVLPLMEYKVKAGVNFSASYNEGVITVTANGVNSTINVVNDSARYTVTNQTYENKALKYEENAVEEESHHVMLAGSSSIEFWTTSKQDLDPVVSYNHGIGGTTIEEWDQKLNQRLVFPYKPKMVVYYVGINNVINTEQGKEEIWTHLRDFLDHTHAALPDTKVQYIMMNLIPGYTAKFETINFVNAKVIEYNASNPWLKLINPGTALVKENGIPNAAYFRTDGLHLSYYGYVIWGGIIKESILEGLKNN